MAANPFVGSVTHSSGFIQYRGGIARQQRLLYDYAVNIRQLGVVIRLAVARYNILGTSN
jgi:hypothetical protein